MVYAFYFVFYAAIFWMIEYSFANAFHALSFSWLVVIACAAGASYAMVWLNENYE